MKGVEFILPYFEEKKSTPQVAFVLDKNRRRRKRATISPRKQHVHS